MALKKCINSQQDTADHIIAGFRKKGWIVYRIYEINLEEIKEVLK